MSTEMVGRSTGGHWNEPGYGGGHHAAGEGHHAAGEGHHAAGEGHHAAGEGHHAAGEGHSDDPFSLSKSYIRTDRAGTEYISSGMLRDAKASGSQLKNKADYDHFIDANAKKFGLDPELVKRQYRIESNGDPSCIGDRDRNWESGGPSIGLLQVTTGILDGGVWARPGYRGVIKESDTGRLLARKELDGNPAVQLLSGMQHLADYKNEAKDKLGAGASSEAIYRQALGGYVGHDQNAYINNIEKNVNSGDIL
ncbi:hypothetical protein RCH09_003822 [Actimicrobium sp. GrIS 1.19]|uniref:hypothetical protein n=1 Tax=Actimicrobium sp. GrIS 1.19 TaxID=3071708 RepID=UPI002E050C69|nr:hypothetical protein [Actimicrobium sp. GrIS 1.19]